MIMKNVVPLVAKFWSFVHYRAKLHPPVSPPARPSRNSHFAGGRRLRAQFCAYAPYAISKSIHGKEIRL